MTRQNMKQDMISLLCEKYVWQDTDKLCIWSDFSDSWNQSGIKLFKDFNFFSSVFKS